MCSHPFPLKSPRSGNPGSLHPWKRQLPSLPSGTQWKRSPSSCPQALSSSPARSPGLPGQRCGLLPLSLPIRYQLPAFSLFPRCVENFLRLFVDGLYFILILCFQRERVFAARLCRFQIACDPLSSFSSTSRAGLKRKYDITKNRIKILIPVITMSLIH